MASFKKNIAQLTESIKTLGHENCQVMVASKYGSAEQLRMIYHAGLNLFGENRIQDAIHKITHLSDLNITWHFIGHLQRNKVKLAVHYFDCIQSIDSIRLLEKIDSEARLSNQVMPVFLQVNLANEPQKFGFDPLHLTQEINRIKTYSNCSITGLMIMLPFIDNTQQLSIFCKEGYDLFVSLKSYFPGLIHLSMGMSHDYIIALRHGSTMVRIGRAIFNQKE